MSSRIFLGWAVGITFLLVQRPIFSPDLWWHLSRGREVASGTIAPASTLLSLDMTNEADWCSGLPFYLGWTFGGIHLLAAIPLLATGALAFFAWTRISRNYDQIVLILLLPFMLWTIRDGLQPVPQLFDLLGMILLWRVMHSNISSRGKFAGIFLLFMAWGNLGPRPIWGLLWLILIDWEAYQRHASQSQIQRKQKTKQKVQFVSQGRLAFQLLVAAFLGGMLTPRGLLTWRDSVILLAPVTFSNLELYGEPTWASPFINSPWTSAEYAFLLLWCLWVGLKVENGWSQRTNNEVTRNVSRGPFKTKGKQFQTLETLTFLNSESYIKGFKITSTLFKEIPRLLLPVTRFCVPLIAAMLSRENLPVCGLWILLDLLQKPVASTSHATRAASNWQRFVPAALAMILLCPVLLDASGRGLHPYHRLGWGISQEVDPRLLDSRLLSVSEKKVIGWAPDGRSVGLATWLDGNLQMADHPQRAFLGGRTQLHTALIYDLQGDHRARYRRDDGTWGGWVRKLASWNVEMLFVPIERQHLHHALVKSPWRPVDLDSPAVPFISSENSDYSSIILETLQQQGFVEFGPWQPTLQIYDGLGWRYDLVETIGFGPDPAAAIRQSQLFRSMDIPLASLRALLPVRKLNQQHSLWEEFRACQIDLAYQEWMTFGEASYFRRIVVDAITENQTLSPPLWTITSVEEAEAEAWNQSVELYLQGRIEDAINILTFDTSQRHFAVAMLWIELGEPRQALQELERILSTSQDQLLLIAAEYWQQQVRQFSGQ